MVGHVFFALVAITGYGQESDKLEAKESGFDYHYTKPVNVKDLAKFIRTSMAN